VPVLRRFRGSLYCRPGPTYSFVFQIEYYPHDGPGITETQTHFSAASLTTCHVRYTNRWTQKRWSVPTRHGVDMTGGGNGRVLLAVAHAEFRERNHERNQGRSIAGILQANSSASIPCFGRPTRSAKVKVNQTTRIRLCRESSPTRHVAKL